MGQPVARFEDAGTDEAALRASYSAAFGAGIEAGIDLSNDPEGHTIGVRKATPPS